MNKFLPALLMVALFYHVQSQYTTVYENSFRNWLPGQGWVMLSNDTVNQQMGLVTKSVTAGIPIATVETMDFMLGIAYPTNWYYSIGEVKGQMDKVMISPPLTLGADPYTYFYTHFKGGAHFDLYVVANPNDTTINGLTTKVLSCTQQGYNVASLSNWANTTIRLAFRLTGYNTFGVMDNLTVINKTGLATIPDSCFRAYLQTAVPSAFIGDQLDFLSPVVLNTTTLNCPNSCIRSLEGLQYFPFLDTVNFSNNVITYIPLNQLYYIDSIDLSNNLLSAAPDVPIGLHVNYSNNLLSKVPNVDNEDDQSLNMAHNLLYTCLDGTNRFATLDFTGTGSVNFGGFVYYNFTDDVSRYLYLGPGNCEYAYADIYGTVFYDMNQNGVLDPTDIKIQNQRIDFFQGDYVYTHDVGQYIVSADTGLINMNVTALPSYFTCTSPLATHLGENQVIQHDFPIIATTSTTDLGVTVTIPRLWATVNTPFTLLLTARNYGTGTVTGVVKMYIPPTNTPYSSSTYGTLVNDTLTWTITIPPFGSVSNYVTLGNHYSSPTSVPFYVSLSTPGDVNPVNDTGSCLVNIYYYRPHDPNSKTVTSPKVAPGYDGYHYYNLSFENTGQGNATRVIVRDYLSHQFDFNSLEVIGSSHPYSVSWGHDSILQFTFYPITLTPKSIDSTHSDGYVLYRIKTLHQLQSGQSVGNYAGIYFDNEPVVNTDTAWVYAGTLHAAFTGGDTTECGTYYYVPYKDISGGTITSRQWTFAGGTPATSTIPAPSVHYTSSGTFKVTLIITAKEYTDTAIRYVHITYDSLPTGSITSSKNALCTGDTALLTAPAGWPGISYHWSDSSTARTLITHGGTYSVTVSNASGCKAVWYNYLTPTVPAPVITDTSNCQSLSAYLKVSNTTYPHYLWSTANSDTLNAVKVTHYGLYTVQVKDNNGCTGTGSFNFVSHAPPVVTIVGDTLPCSNIGTALGTRQTFVSYYWVPGGSTSPSIYPYFPATYTVTVTDSNGCVGRASVVYNTIPVSQPVISGATNFCKGSTSTLKVTSGFSRYLWSTAATDSSITVSDGGAYYVTAFAANGCIATTSTNVTVRDKFNLNVHIQNSGTCPGQNIQLTAIYNKGTLTGTPSGASTQSPSVGSGSTTETYSSELLSNAHNGEHQQLFFTARELKAAIGGAQLITKISFQLASPLGSNSPVQNFTLKLGFLDSVNFQPGVWQQGLTQVYYTASVTPVAGWNSFALNTPLYWNGTSSLVVDVCSYNPTTSGYTANNAVTSSTSFSGHMFNYSATDICGESGYGTYNSNRPNVKFDYANVSGSPAPVQNPSFNWYAVDGNATIYSPHTPVTSAVADSLVKFIVTVSDTFGCADIDSVWAIGQAYSKVTLTTYNTVLCEGDSALICAPATNGAYLWNTADSSQCISAHNAGDYWVSVSDLNHCTVQSNHVSITASVVPVITENNNVLSTTATGTYQWYLNNAPISGAHASSYTVQGSGLYSLQVTDSNGCHNFSNTINVTATSVKNTTVSSVISIYPNPTTNSWQLSVGNNLIGAKLDMYNIEGQLVFNSAIRNQKSAIPATGLPAGVYFLRISSDNEVQAVKLVKE